MPTLDGQTIVSIIIGAVISIATFWIGYRKTTGAAEERIRSANSELIQSLIRRVAIERQSLDSDQFKSLRDAKSYQKGIEKDALIAFSMAKSMVFQEVVDSNFLDNSSKNEIIFLLEGCEEKACQLFSLDEEIGVKKFDILHQVSSSLAAVSITMGLVSAGIADSFATSETINSLVNKFVNEKYFSYVLFVLLAIFIGVRIYSVFGSPRISEVSAAEDSSKL